MTRPRPRRFLGWSALAGALVLMMLAASACEDPTTGDAFTGFEAGAFEFEAGPNAPNTAPDAAPADVLAPVVDAAADADASAADAEVDAAVDAAPLPACGDGTLDPGELCDPLASCPTKCPQVVCQLRTLENAGTCTAKCVDGAMQTACINGDGCCPAGGVCNKNNDDDCAATCGNSVLEGTETCDPLASCPQSCPAVGCQLKTLSGGGTCNAKCVDNGLQAACANADGCCPPGCNANNDSDCGPGCGNNVVEPGETCDPLTSCPQACPQNKCQLQTLQNAGTCSAQCVDSGLQTLCVNNDSCCPANCNANNDNDCAPKCNNGVVEAGETCDPVLTSCPTTCPQKVCQLYTLDNPGTCQAVCTATSTQTKCVNNDDGCCPSGCNANIDSDCKPKCGNGVVEAGETCDLPITCPKGCSETYTCYQSTGTQATCDFACHVPVTKCGVSGDNCCPFDGSGGCDSTTDKECTGGAWKFYVWPTPIDTTKGCIATTIHNIYPGGSYDFTTCAPPGNGTGTGDPDITSIVDAKGTPYAVGNDNCTDKTALPYLANSDCNNKAGVLTMACASPSPGGFIVQAGTSILTVTICPVGGAAKSGGTTPLYIWYNAPGEPTTK